MGQLRTFVRCDESLDSFPPDYPVHPLQGGPISRIGILISFCLGFETCQLKLLQTVWTVKKV